jgi:serine/threonine-protein kinase CTR1
MNWGMVLQAHAKIADFGVSRWKDNTFLSATSGCGTVTYTAPEILCNELVNEKADVYSFGVLLWECLTVQRPWKQHTVPVQVLAQP